MPNFELLGFLGDFYLGFDHLSLAVPIHTHARAHREIEGAGGKRIFRASIPLFYWFLLARTEITKNLHE